MTETTAAAAAIPQAANTATAIPPAANQLPVSGADIANAASGTPAAPEITSALIVDATLWILIGFSVATWALILVKGIQHLRIAHHNKIYGKQFWGAQDFQAAAALEGNQGPAARVAGVGLPP
ncbi:MAG: hypothetical protein ACXWF8_14185 [Methylobacter sp.]